MAVAGRTGLAHYSILQRKWRLFGNETQEKDFIVTGGLLWWRDCIVVGCYNLAALQDEVRIYPRTEKLNNDFARILKVETQVLLLNLLENQRRCVGLALDDLLDLRDQAGRGLDRLGCKFGGRQSLAFGNGFYPLAHTLSRLRQGIAIDFETSEGWC